MDELGRGAGGREEANMDIDEDMGMEGRNRARRLHW
jgi:hypothetical protein